MAIFWSPTRHGFFSSALGDVPADAIAISATEHLALMEGQAEGRRIVSGPDGAPILEDRPEPTEAEKRALFRQTAQVPRIDMTEALIAEGILTDAEAETFAGHELPQPLLDMVAQLPVEMQSPARRRLKAAGTFYRSEPMWDEVPASVMTSEQIDRLHGFTS